jgi:cell division protein ZapA (FtsZ GTPase activity inhibitor)
VSFSFVEIFSANYNVFFSRSMHEDHLNDCQRRLENKTQELKEMEESIQQMGTEHADEITRNRLVNSVELR